jgi:hypothetical protein
MRERMLTVLLVLSLIANVFFVVIAFFPEVGVFPPASSPSGANACPATTVPLPAPSLLTEGGGVASLQAPVILQRIEPIPGGPFSRERVTEEGAMVNVSVEVESGRGRVLVQTTPLMGVVFQDAANVAVLVAEEQSGVNLSGSDVIFSIQAPNEVSSIDGPSAGALMTTILLSVMEGFPVNESVTLTGTIETDGSIGQIGGAVEKGQAAAASGKTLLLLPRENSRLVVYQEVTRSFNGLSMTEERPVFVDSGTYIEENFGIQVEYVETIEDVLAIVRPSGTPGSAPVTASV